MSHGSNESLPDVRLRHARAMAVELQGEAWALTRQAFIDSLPLVPWKGRTLYTLRCHGVTGRGPHDCNVPASLIWHLIDPRRWRCVYHA